MNVYEMKLHDEITESPWYITRVPGGWTYLHNESGTSPVFVPFNNDLQETPKIKESQKTDKQQTQPVIPLPEECVFVPMADKLGIDINLAAKLYDAVVAKQQAGA